MTARRSLLREPVLHFALGALALAGVDRALAHRRHPDVPARPRIVVSAATVAALRAGAATTAGAAPVDERGLVDAWVRDEALAREALARGLDVGDPVIRRRLVQKMLFVLEADNAPPEPDDAALRRWLTAHASEYHRAATVAFEQVFFDRARRRDAHADATAALAAMAPDEPLDRALPRGDASPRGGSVPALRFADVTRLFGYDLARLVDTAPVGRWQGPVASPQGWHLVRVTTRDPGGDLAFDAVRDDVRRRWRDERREQLLQAAIARVLSRYEVQR